MHLEQGLVDSPVVLGWVVVLQVEASKSFACNASPMTQLAA